MHKLTYKLWGAKYVFEIVAKVNLVRQAKVDELDAWMRHCPVEEHDVLGLERDKGRERETQGESEIQMLNRAAERAKRQRVHQ